MTTLKSTIGPDGKEKPMKVAASKLILRGHAAYWVHEQQRRADIVYGLGLIAGGSIAIVGMIIAIALL